GNQVESTVEIIEVGLDRVIISVVYANIDDGNRSMKINEKFTLDKDGVMIESELIDADQNQIFFTVPLLETNGTDETDIVYEDGQAMVRLKDDRFIVSSDGQID